MAVHLVFLKESVAVPCLCENTLLKTWILWEDESFPGPWAAGRLCKLKREKI